MTIESSQTLVDNVKIKYLCTMVRGEALTHFDTLSAEVGSTSFENLKIYFWFGYVLFPVNTLSKKYRTIFCGINKPYFFKVRLYTYPMIDPNDYLSVFLGDNFFEMELNEIFLNRVPNSWSRQAYVQGVLLWNHYLLKISKHAWTHVNSRIYLWRCCRTFLQKSY